VPIIIRGMMKWGRKSLMTSFGSNCRQTLSRDEVIKVSGGSRVLSSHMSILILYLSHAV
jgi:hypothetical protein